MSSSNIPTQGGVPFQSAPQGLDQNLPQKKKGFPLWAKILIPVLVIGLLLFVAVIGLVIFLASQGSNKPIDKAESPSSLIQEMKAYPGFECTDPKDSSVSINNNGKLVEKLPAVVCPNEAFIIDYTGIVSKEKARMSFAKSGAVIIFAKNFGEDWVNGHTFTGKKYVVVLDPSVSADEMQKVIGGGSTKVDLSKGEVKTVEKH